MQPLDLVMAVVTAGALYMARETRLEGPAKWWILGVLGAVLVIFVAREYLDAP
jgi:hypothetical protein